MKMECDIVRDLMDMYAEDLCSAASRRAVEEHLAECEACRKKLEAMNRIEEEAAPEPVSEGDMAVIRSLGKIRRRWIRSLIAVLLVVPVIVLAVGQVRGQGLCFTNIDDILLAYRYAHALETGDFEKAADYMDYSRIYADIMDALSWEISDYMTDSAKSVEEAQRLYDFNQKYYAGAKEMSPETFEAFMKARYASELKTLGEQGMTFKCTGYRDSYYISDNGFWVVEYGMQAVTDDETYRFYVDIGVHEGGRLSVGSMSHIAEGAWFDNFAKTIFMSWPGEA